jgi:hypothetical protein
MFLGMYLSSGVPEEDHAAKRDKAMAITVTDIKTCSFFTIFFQDDISVLDRKYRSGVSTNSNKIAIMSHW